jgi:SAM-dependent methyltransferase
VTRRSSAGDYDYETGGAGYAVNRRPDPRIEARLLAALGDARTVINVGAGAGSYEPTDREVTAVEPSAAMRAQRPSHLTPAVDAVAEDLPYPDDHFDAAMASVTVHQWSDTDGGLRELRRVSRGPVVVLTFDGEALDRFWLAEYAPEVIEIERRRYPTIDHIARVLGGSVKVDAIPVPIDCTDGFSEAFYARPERLLDPAVRLAQSAWGLADAAVVDTFVDRLSADLASGEWERKYGTLRQLPEFAGSLRLITARP